MTPRSRAAPLNRYRGAMQALGVPLGTMELGGGRTVLTCGVCEGTDTLKYEVMHSPPAWKSSEAFGWAHARCDRRARRELDAGHVQMGLKL